MDAGSRPVRTAGVAAPALPGCGRRRRSLAKGIVGGCRRQCRERGPLGGGGSTRHPRNLIRYVRMGSAVRGGVGLAKATRRLAAKGIKSWAKEQKVRG